MELVTVTPRDIDEMSLGQVLELVEESNRKGLPSKSARLGIVKSLFQVLGLELSPDAALVMVDVQIYQQIIAVAGSGKTTLSQVKIIFMKILYFLENQRMMNGTRALCLVYNEHNVADMQLKHKSMVDRVRLSGILGGIKITDEISAMTVHSLAMGWLREYSFEAGIDDSDLLGDEEGLRMLKDAFSIVAKKQGLAIQQNYFGIKSLYDFTKERMVQVTDPLVEDKCIELGLNAGTLDLVFRAYDSYKKRNNKYDYIEMLTKFKTLLETNEKARLRVQGYYDLVVLDEVQDFTPLMGAIAKLVIGDNKPAVLVGDEDQLLYDFKGAIVDEILRFTEIYEGGKVYILNRNRRCKSQIVDAASYIVSENVNRFDKKILPAGQGGSLELIGYSTEEGQILSVANRIEKMTPIQRSNLAIGYRNTINSMLLADELEKRGIEFNVVSGYGAFEHELYKNMIRVLDCLSLPFNVNLHINLSRVMPISFPDLCNILGWDFSRGRYKEPKAPVHFKNIDYGKYSGYKKFSQNLNVLVSISDMIGKAPMKDYIPALFNMIMEYSWAYKLSQMEERGRDMTMENLFTKRVFEFFNSDMKYEDFFKEYSRRVTVAKRADSAKAGVTLSTFHGLKGREFEEVWLLYLDDAIFPGKVEDLESETRLAYVAMTRPKDKLKMFYNMSNPSYYVNRLMKYQEQKEQEQPKSLESMQAFPDVSEMKKSSTSKSTDIFGKSNYLNELFKNL